MGYIDTRGAPAFGPTGPFSSLALACARPDVSGPQRRAQSYSRRAGSRLVAWESRKRRASGASVFAELACLVVVVVLRSVIYPHVLAVLRFP